MGFFDVWRDLNPKKKDFSYYSAVHSVYSRIDYFFMQKENRDKIQDCQIGVADVSDHCAIYLNIKLGCRRRDTLWRLTGILNNKLVVEQIKDEIQKYLEENNNNNTDPAVLWDALKAVIRGKLISITSNLKKVIETQYNNLSADLKQLEQTHKEKNTKTKTNQRGEKPN